MSARQRLGLLAQVGGALCAGTGVLCAGVGCFGAHSIHQRRQRWFSDNFVLTPETLRLPYKKIEIRTEDEVRLGGWFIERTVRGETSKNLAVCFCPFNQDKSSLLGVARGLWDGGYSVLLFDFRSHGPDPTAQSVGYLERRDGRAALDWVLANKPEGGRVGLVGASMGGAVALMVAAENRPDVVACATDCAFSSLKDVVGVRLDKMFPTTRLFGLDSFVPLHRLFLESIRLVTLWWYGYDISLVGPKAVLGDIRVPLLIVHSEHDSVVPLSHGLEIFGGAATKPEDKHFLVVKGEEHIGAYFRDEKAYTGRIVEFFDQCFARDKGALFVAGHDAGIVVPQQIEAREQLPQEAAPDKPVQTDSK